MGDSQTVLETCNVEPIISGKSLEILLTDRYSDMLYFYLDRTCETLKSLNLKQKVTVLVKKHFQK